MVSQSAYVTCSRVNAPNSLVILALSQKLLKNVVYSAVLWEIGTYHLLQYFANVQI